MQTINYPRLAGQLEGAMRSLPFVLKIKQLIHPDDEESIEIIIKNMLIEINKDLTKNH